MRRLTLTAGALVLALSAPSTSLAEAREIHIALQAPSDSHIGENLLGFAEQVEASETMELEVILHDAGDPYADSQIRAAVAAGEMDMGVVTLNRFTEDLPSASFFHLPFYFSTLEDHQRVTAMGHPVREAIDAMIEETGVLPLWWQSYGQVALLSAGPPAKTPLSLEGNKVRVFNAEGGLMVEAAKGASARLPGLAMSGAFEARGLDYALVDLPTLARLELWRWTQSLTLGSFGAVEMVVIANPDFWESLSEDQRTLIEVAAAAADEAGRAALQDIEAAALAAAKEGGMALYKLGREELATWLDVKQAMTEAYLARAGGTGEWLLDAMEGEVETPGD